MTSISIPYPTVPTDSVCIALDTFANTLEAVGYYATAIFFPQIGIPASLAGKAIKVTSNLHCRDSSSLYETIWNSPLELAVDAIQTISTLYTYYQRCFKTRNSLLTRPSVPIVNIELQNLRKKLNEMGPIQTRFAGATAKEVNKNKRLMNAANAARKVLMNKITNLELQNEPTKQVSKTVHLSSIIWERLKAFSVAFSGAVVKASNQKTLDNEFFKKGFDSLLRHAKLLGFDLSQETSLNELAQIASTRASDAIDKLHGLSKNVIDISWRAFQNPHKKINSEAEFDEYHQHLRVQYGIGETTISTIEFLEQTSDKHKVQTILEAFDKRLFLFKLMQIISEALQLSLGFREGTKIKDQLSLLGVELHQNMADVYKLILRLRECEAAAIDLEDKSEDFKNNPGFVKDLKRMKDLALSATNELAIKLSSIKILRSQMSNLLAGSIKSERPHKVDVTKLTFPIPTQTSLPILTEVKNILDEIDRKFAYKLPNTETFQFSSKQASLLPDDESSS
ncbi:MAG: hypothetical protein S4CHLAM6_06080 [Chlamydiae bacterium]|nr:hypothetical protein [Chlamydiota bacterium]